MRLRRKAAVVLALSMEDRGNQSTGMATVKNNVLELTKKAISSSEFIELPEFRDRVLNTPILIGHTRLATQGAVTDENAHPFLKGKIVGAHNGIVNNWRELNKDVQVDSEVIFEKLNEHGNDYKKAFAELSGSFALSWLNLEQPHNFFLVRHTNPLYFFVSPRIKTLFWCSEMLPLKIVQSAILGDAQTIYEPVLDTVMNFNGGLKYVTDDIEFKPYSYPKSVTTYDAEEWNDKWSKKQKKKNHHRSNPPILLPPVKGRVDGQELGTDGTIDDSEFPGEALTSWWCNGCNSVINLEYDGYYESEDEECLYCRDCAIDFKLERRQTLIWRASTYFPKARINQSLLGIKEDSKAVVH